MRKVPLTLFTQRCRSFRRSGTIVVWVLLAITVIVGIVALGMDGGRMMEERRHAQCAADAAALAAGGDLYQNYSTNHGLDISGTAQAAALSTAAANGFANDGQQSIVTVNVPPQSGAFAGQAGYVEVIVQSKMAASFGKIFTAQDLQIQARSVALGQPVKVGLLLLSGSGAGTLVNRALALTIINSAIIVNSNDPGAYDQAGPGVVLAKRYDLTGNYVNPGGALMLGPIRTGVPPTPDLFAYLPIPDTVTAPVQAASPKVIDSQLPTILQPGRYQGGISVSGSSIVTMMPGVYIMEGGGFQVSGNATVLGSEVMIYNTVGSYAPGPIQINSMGKIALQAPLSGTYQGIGIFQNRSMTQALSVTGSGLTTIAGVVYAAAAPVNLTGGALIGADLLGAAYVCASMQVSGLGGINIDLGLNPPRVPDVHLVE